MYWHIHTHTNIEAHTYTQCVHFPTGYGWGLQCYQRKRKGRGSTFLYWQQGSHKETTEFHWPHIQWSFSVHVEGKKGRANFSFLSLLSPLHYCHLIHLGYLVIRVYNCIIRGYESRAFMIPSNNPCTGKARLNARHLNHHLSLSLSLSLFLSFFFSFSGTHCYIDLSLHLLFFNFPFSSPILFLSPMLYLWSNSLLLAWKHEY